MFYRDVGILLLIPAMILAVYAQSRVRSAYERFARVNARSGLSGAEVAARLLSRSGLDDVQVQQARGMLTDHYDPRQKVVRLSPQIYSGTSLAALGIAAHETGHAIQHDLAYVPLAVRNSIFPLASFGSRMAFPLFFIGLIFAHSPISVLMDIGIAFFLFAVAFQVITLPVEFNASSRALELLTSEGYITTGERAGVKQVLDAAALTYIAATAVAVAQLLRLLILRGNRR